MDKILIRCITEKSKGYGNFSRALTLAESLKKNNSITFLINPNKFLELVLKKKKINFHLIPKKNNFQNEYTFISNYFVQNEFKLLILDMREYGERLSEQITSEIPIVLIDDAFCKNVYSDIVINGSINKKFHNYKIKNEKTKLFLGAKYFMADKNFLKNKKFLQNINLRKTYTIVVSIGGSDPNNLTLKIIKSIIDLSNINIIVIVGPFFKEKSNLKILATNCKNIEIKYTPEKIWNEFKKADVVISKSGITLYELAIMGIPTLCISSFKHEEPSAKKFMDEKVLVNLGMQKNVTKNLIKTQLIKLLEDVKKRKKMSKQGHKIIDGKGIFRVTKIIESFLSKI